MNRIECFAPTRYREVVPTSFQAQSTKYERQRRAECRWNYIHVKDEDPGSNPGGPPKIDEGHSSNGQSTFSVSSIFVGALIGPQITQMTPI
jgi:hypothetical protein